MAATFELVSPRSTGEAETAAMRILLDVDQRRMERPSGPAMMLRARVVVWRCVGGERWRRRPKTAKGRLDRFLASKFVAQWSESSISQMP